MTPYTAKSKVLAQGRVSSMRPSSNAIAASSASSRSPATSLFKGDSSVRTARIEEEDDRIARLAIRYILCNPSITAPIPGNDQRRTKWTT
jgi:aryl-alcohol dehydrogenase-like predicted oxidoreductase